MNTGFRTLPFIIMTLLLFACQTPIPLTSQTPDCNVVGPAFPFQVAEQGDIKYIQPMINKNKVIVFLRDTDGITKAVLVRNSKVLRKVKRKINIHTFLLVNSDRAIKAQLYYGQPINNKKRIKIDAIDHVLTILNNPEKDMNEKMSHSPASALKDVKLLQNAWEFTKPRISNICLDAAGKSSIQTKTAKAISIGTGPGPIYCFIDDEWCRSLWEDFFANGMDWNWSDPSNPGRDNPVDTSDYYPDDHGLFDSGSLAFTCATNKPDYCSNSVRGQGLQQSSRDEAVCAAKDSACTQCGVNCECGVVKDGSGSAPHWAGQYVERDSNSLWNACVWGCCRSSSTVPDRR